MGDGTRGSQSDRPEPEGRETVPLFSIDADLAEGLSDEERADASRVVRAWVAGIDTGPWEGPGSCAGLCVVQEGFLLRLVSVSERVAGEILGPGDVLVAGEEEGSGDEVSIEWRALVPSRLAHLDPSAFAQAGRWPRVQAQLMRRASGRALRLAAGDAVARIPRVEDRILAVLWDLASRWGKVTTDGTLLPVPLTHEILSFLAWARRPTVTTALNALLASGGLTRRPDGLWVLAERTRAPSLVDLARKMPGDTGAEDSGETPAPAALTDREGAASEPGPPRAPTPIDLARDAIWASNEARMAQLRASRTRLRELRERQARLRAEIDRRIT